MKISYGLLGLEDVKQAEQCRCDGDCWPDTLAMAHPLLSFAFAFAVAAPPWRRSI